MQYAARNGGGAESRALVESGSGGSHRPGPPCLRPFFTVPRSFPAAIVFSLIEMRVFALAVLTSAAAFAHGKLPVAFEPNRGQAETQIQYIAHGNGYTLALRADRAELLGRGGRIAATLVGARPTQGQAESPLPGVVNYLADSASSSHPGIPTYARVRYREVYPGIDVVYYGTEGQLEYDFVLAPGADPRKIRVRYEGASRLRLDARGDLLIRSASGELRQPRPTIYQEIAGRRRPVAGGYALHGQTVRFEVAAYDRTRPLVIDPTLTWASYFGGGLTDQVLAVTTDAAGNVYSTGSTLSSRGDYDCFITKMNPAGTAVLFTIPRVGGVQGDDECFGIAVDSAGNIYVAGYTGSDDFPIVAVSATLAGLGYDAFIAKVNPTGTTYLYAGFVGGSGDEFAYGLALDANNNLWIAGGTSSTNFPLSRTGAQRTLAGGYDAFVSQFDPNGGLLYSSYLGGGGDDFAYGIALDAAGNVYVAGPTVSTDFPGTASGFQPANAGGTDAWAAKLSPSGGLLWATYLGGSADDEATAVAVDGSGAVYLTGDTTSSNFPTVKAYQGAFAGGAHDIMAAKIGPDGTKLVYSTYLGGSGDEIGNAIVVDTAGVAYVGGSSNSTDFPASFAFQSANRGGIDGTITAFSPAGDTLQFSSYIGGTLDDYVEALSVSCTTGLLLGGATVSTNFPVTAGVAQPKYAGGAADGFLAQVAAGTGVAAAISPGGIVNAATSASAPVSPGSLVSLYGANLGSGVFNAATTPLATTLGGTTVTVNEVAVPLVYVSAGQINFQLPYEVLTGTASAAVTAGCGASTAATFQVVRAAPYIFLNADASAAVVQNQDFSINGPNQPAKVGSVVTVYLTGIGPVSNAPATGAPASLTTLAPATLAYTATIGGFDSVAQFLGLTPGFVGLAQANLFVPNLSPGKYPIVIAIDGVASNAGSMWVQ